MFEVLMYYQLNMFVDRLTSSSLLPQMIDFKLDLLTNYYLDMTLAWLHFC